MYKTGNILFLTKGLAEIQKALDQPQLKIKHACDTRWLSHNMAVTALRRCLPAVASSLSREAVERNVAHASFWTAEVCTDV